MIHFWLIETEARRNLFRVFLANIVSTVTTNAPGRIFLTWLLFCDQFSIATLDES